MGPYAFRFFKLSPGAGSFFAHCSAAALGHVAGAMLHDQIKAAKKDKKLDPITYRK